MTFVIGCYYSLLSFNCQYFFNRLLLCIIWRILFSVLVALFIFAVIMQHINKKTSDLKKSAIASDMNHLTNIYCLIKPLVNHLKWKNWFYTSSWFTGGGYRVLVTRNDLLRVIKQISVRGNQTIVKTTRIKVIEISETIRTSKMANAISGTKKRNKATKRFQWNTKFKNRKMLVQWSSNMKSMESWKEQK